MVGRLTRGDACLHISSGTHASEHSRLARKPNYDYEKRRKETERQAKKDAKKEERLRRKALGIVDEFDEFGNPIVPDESGDESVDESATEEPKP